jgi:hypothetical protein
MVQEFVHTEKKGQKKFLENNNTTFHIAGHKCTRIGMMRIYIGSYATLDFMVSFEWLLWVFKWLLYGYFGFYNIIQLAIDFKSFGKVWSIGVYL